MYWGGIHGANGDEDRQSQRTATTARLPTHDADLDADTTVLGHCAYIYALNVESVLSDCKKRPVSARPCHQRCSIPGVNYLYAHAYLSSIVRHSSYPRQNHGANVSRVPHRGILHLQWHRRPMGRTVRSFSYVLQGNEHGALTRNKDIHSGTHSKLCPPTMPRGASERTQL